MKECAPSRVKVGSGFWELNISVGVESVVAMVTAWGGGEWRQKATSVNGVDEISGSGSLDRNAGIGAESFVFVVRAVSMGRHYCYRTMQHNV